MFKIEPIRKSLNQIRIPSFQERYNQMKKEILENEAVLDFFEKNQKDITKEMVERSLSKLYEFISQKNTCCRIGKVEDCCNMLQGFVPQLYIVRDNIEIKYEPCEQQVIENEHKETKQMIESMYMPKEVLNATMNDVLPKHESRIQLLEKLLNFLSYVEKDGNLPSKGMYIHGKFGVGKSFVLGAVANELALLKVKSVLVFVPEFIREMKNSIKDNSLEGKIDYVKKAPVLMLDDFGAESMSPWVRDEILAPILNYRMSEQLPTFITSNFNYDELYHHLTYSNKGDEEVVKARRIMERVKAMTVPFELEGDNLRNS